MKRAWKKGIIDGAETHYRFSGPETAFVSEMEDGAFYCEIWRAGRFVLKFDMASLHSAKCACTATMKAMENRR